MLDEFVVEQLKTDLVTGLDVHVGLSSGAGRTLVAPQIVAISCSATLLGYSFSKGETNESMISMKDGM